MIDKYELRFELLNLFTQKHFDVSISEKCIRGYTNPKYTNEQIYSTAEFLAESKFIKHLPINYEVMSFSVKGLTSDGEHNLEFVEEKRKSDTLCGKFLKALPIIDLILAVIAILIALLVTK